MAGYLDQVEIQIYMFISIIVFISMDILSCIHIYYFFTILMKKNSNVFLFIHV